MVNIKDVAKEAGVSIAAVSYAMNNRPEISEETKKRILEAVKKLNYHPSGAAKNLKRRKTNMIGVFMEGIAGPYYGRMIQGVQRGLRKGYGLIVTTVNEEQKTNFNLLSERWVDAGIIFNSEMLTEDFILRISENTPIVLMDRPVLLSLPKEKKHYVRIIHLDNSKGAYQAVEYLIRQGYKDIAFLSGNTSSYDNQQRFEGYRKALEAYHIPYNPRRVLMAGFREEASYHLIKELVEKKDLPEAIFSANDEMAMGAINAFHEMGVKIPDEVAVVGFDDIPAASMITPALTTIRYGEIGNIAANLIFEMLDENTLDAPVFINTELVVRESAGKKTGG
jgi:LacI family transcriptional regulator